MSDLRSPWETYRAPITPGHPHFVECAPDLYVPELLDLSPDMIADLGVEHVFIDFDGTMAAHGNRPPVSEAMFDHVRTFAEDARFQTFGIATDSLAHYMGDVAATIGENVKLFQPLETPKESVMKFHPGFYRRILFETDIWDTPERAVMIGDSLRYDILNPHQQGMKTVLVDRLERRLASHIRERLEAIDSPE